MSFFNYNAVKAWIANNEIHVQLGDGRVAQVPIANFPLLASATAEQLSNFEIVKGYALYWPELREDLSIAAFFEKEHQKEFLLQH